MLSRKLLQIHVAKNILNIHTGTYQFSKKPHKDFCTQNSTEIMSNVTVTTFPRRFTKLKTELTYINTLVLASRKGEVPLSIEEKTRCLLPKKI